METYCDNCGRPLEALGAWLSRGFDGACTVCAASADDPKAVAYLHSIPAGNLVRSTLHGVSTTKVVELWQNIQRAEAKFQEPGVWVLPPIPAWIQLLYLSARS